MSALITTKLVAPGGEITNPFNGGYIDAAGNVQGSLGFLTNHVVDIAGNIGTITSGDPSNCAFDVPLIGSSFEPGPWEMQLGLVETSRANNGIISTSFPANTASPTLSSFVSINSTGYMQGVVSGAGTWTIRSGPDNIDGVNYLGTGLLVTSGANTHSGTLAMQDGTKLQLGADCSNTVTTAKGNLTIGLSATCTQFSAHTAATTYVSQALTNSGTYNVTGCGVCGQGGLLLSTSVTNNGVINIDKAMWRNQFAWAGTGTVNVKDGGTFQMAGNNIGSTTRININGDGWCNASGEKLGAIHATSNGFTYGARVHVESAATIKTAVNVNVTFSGLLTGSAPLTVGNLAATKPNGVVHFENTANTYFGTMTVDGTALNSSYGNSLQYANIVLANGGRLSTSTNSSQAIGSLASSDSTTYWASGDPVNNVITANGITTYAGRLLWSGGQYAANYFLNGGPENELTMTGTGNTGSVYPRNGARLILQGATFIGAGGQVRAQTGATVSAGTSITASVSYLYIDSTSKLEVKVVGAGVSLMTVTLGFVPSAGWKVDLPDAMVAGIYPIVKYSGTATATLPTIGTNLSGRSVSFAYNNAVNPKLLNMILS